MGRRRRRPARCCARAARSTRSTCCPLRSRSRRSCRRATCGRCKLLYGIGGLSYGNVSARYTGGDLPGVPDADGPVYWMSASGVDKADLRIDR